MKNIYYQITAPVLNLQDKCQTTSSEKHSGPTVERPNCSCIENGVVVWQSHLQCSSSIPYMLAQQAVIVLMKGQEQGKVSQPIS